MPTIRWSNGQIDKAHDWQALLDRVRDTQWREMEEDEFRAVLAVRAARWSGTKIDAEAPVEEFFKSLAEAALIEILDPTTTPVC